MAKHQEGTVKLKVAEIDASEKTREDAGDLLSLAKSIKDHGMLNLIIVDGTTKKLITGWRRLEACKLLKWEEIEVRLFETLSSVERRVIEIEEDITHKKTRSWQEDVLLKKELHDLKMNEAKNVHRGVREKRAWGQQETADMIGISRTLLSEDIRLAEALQHFPELINIPSKTDARRKMYRLRELALLQELARRGKLDPLANRVTFVNDDCMNVLPAIKDDSVDLVITDPPWAIGLKELSGASAIDYKPFADNETEADLYKKVIPHLFRILKEGCHLYLFFGMGRYKEIHDILQNAGFDVREVPCIWVKDKPGYTAWEYKPMPQYEAFFFACKNTKGAPRRLTEATADVFSYPRGKDRIHITEKPNELLKRLITLSTAPGEVVFDPFAGSGSTLVAALICDRRAFGIEKDKENFEWAHGRLKSIAMEEIANKEEKEVAEPPTTTVQPVPAPELTDDEIAMQSVLEEAEANEEKEAEGEGGREAASSM